jgi:hypothetical protein
MLAIYVKPQLKSPAKIKGVLRVRFDEQLESFKQDGTLSAEQADSLRNATRFPLNSSEIVAILGGFFVVIGAIWIIGPLFQDVSQLIVVGIFYLISGLLALAFRSLVKKPQFANAAEVVEALAVLCFTIATGVAVSSLNADSEVSVFVASIPALAYGVWRSTLRRFSSSVIISVSAVAFALSGLAMIGISQDTAGLCLIAVGAVLLWWAQQPKVVGKFTLRFFGSLIALVGLIIPPFDNVSNEYISVAIGVICAVAFFAYGVKKVFPEVVAITAVGVVVSEVKLVTTITDNSTLQGLATLITGALVLILALRNLRRGKSVGSSE